MLAFVLCPLAEGKDKPKYEATPADVAALIEAGEVVGKIGSMPTSEHSFTLIYEYQLLVPRKGSSGKTLSRSQQQLVHRYRQTKQITNPYRQAQQVQQLLQSLQKQQLKGLGTLFKIVSGRKDFEIQADDQVKVRLIKLPVRYDENGKVQPYTAKEKKQLKGKDTKLPGYAATWESLQQDQIVKVYLKAKKKKPAKKPKDKEMADEGDADSDALRARMIVILREPQAEDKPEKEKKAKE
jgi:hypothetical protein